MCRFTSCGWAASCDFSRQSQDTPALPKWFQHSNAVKPPLEEVPSYYLASVATGQKDENSPRRNGGPQPPLVLAEGLLAMTQELAWNILSGVVPGLEAEEQTVVQPVFHSTESFRFRSWKIFFLPGTQQVLSVQLCKGEASSVFLHRAPAQHHKWQRRTCSHVLTISWNSSISPGDGGQPPPGLSLGEVTTSSMGQGCCVLQPRAALSSQKWHVMALNHERPSSFSYHFADFNHSSASILVSTHWLDDGRTWLFLLFLFYL